MLKAAGLRLPPYAVRPPACTTQFEIKQKLSVLCEKNFDREKGNLKTKN